MKNKVNLCIIGPNPDDPSRNGGVAKYIEYLKSVKLSDLDFIENVDFKETDIIFFTKIGLKTLGRFIASVLIAINLLTQRKSKACVHLNATLSPYGGLRILPILIACRLRDIRVITQVHGGRWSNVSGSRFFTAVWGWNFRLSAIIGCFSGPQHSELAALDSVSGKLEKLVNFIPSVSKEIKENDAIVRFLFLGRIQREKGVFDIIDATRFLNERGYSDKFTVSFVGNGPDLDLVKSSSQMQNVKFLGRKSGRDLELELKRHHALVLPSFYPEGFPLVFLEAASFGIAPIVTENSAVVDYFVKDIEYIAVPPKNPDVLSEKMCLFISDRERMVEVASAVRKKVDNHFTGSSDSILEQYRKIYKSCFTKT